MTGTPQNTLQVPLYKICCLIPYQVNEQDIVYLSSVSEINRFLQVHGIGHKFGVDPGRSSTSTCTEDLPIINETRKITSNVRGKRKETYDRQIQYNWKNANNFSCYRNQIFQWHKCCKNESIVHFCKKSNSNLGDVTKNFYPPADIKKEVPKPIEKNSVLEGTGHITSSDSSNLKKECQKSRTEINKNKKANSFTNRSFIRILKRRNKNVHTSVTKQKKETIMKEKSTDMFDKTDTKISLLAESIVCETSAESCTKGGLSDINQEIINSDEIKKRETHDTIANTTVNSPNVSLTPKDENDDDQLKEVAKEIISPSVLSDTSSDQSSTFDCNKEENNKHDVDLTFYESPSKFVESMSECVMRRFIGDECEDSWFKQYEGKKIPKKYLGINKDLSELYILKKMAKHETNTCLISHLTPRQKRLLAKSIVLTLEEFNINGSRWGGLSREILTSVCKLFKNQQGLV